MSEVADFNPEMLTLARRSRELSQTQLAEMCTVSSTSVSRYEAGTLSVTDDNLSRIATALNYPVKFFCRKSTLVGAIGGAIFHRKQQGLPTRNYNHVGLA